MKFAIACAVALLSTASALAEDLNKPHTLDKVTITGSRSVPEDQLLAALQERAGTKVVQDDIVADRDAIMKVLGKANVAGSVGVRIATNTQTKHISVEFVVDDQGVQAPKVVKVAPKLHKQIFDGNKSIDSDKLAAATGLKPGDELSNEKIVAAETAIAQTYKDAKLPLSINLTGSTATSSSGQTDVTWHIVETKAKKKHDAQEDRSATDQ